MDQVTVADFRCFYLQQTARLAPLTLLVGENSTGKTSFLALVRILWDIAYRERLPDFKEPPYDLGTFEEIAHYRGGRGGRALSFQAGFSIGATNRSNRSRRSKRTPAHHRFEFRRDGSGVLPHVRRVANGRSSAECRIASDGLVSLEIATQTSGWTLPPRHLGATDRFASSPGWDSPQRDLPPFGYLLRTFQRVAHSDPERLERADGTEHSPSDKELGDIVRLSATGLRRFGRPFASAPVRSEPRRTYDPAHAISDPEGEHIPMFLASVARTNSRTWHSLKRSIERFGRALGCSCFSSPKFISTRALRRPSDPCSARSPSMDGR